MCREHISSTRTCCGRDQTGEIVLEESRSHFRLKNVPSRGSALAHAPFQGDLVACGIISGNRHFEGRLCNCVRANYLASPPLVVAYALAGTVAIDFEEEPLGEEELLLA